MKKPNKKTIAEHAAGLRLFGLFALADAIEKAGPKKTKKSKKKGKGT